MSNLRVYSITFSGVTVSVVQDLIALYCGASMAVELHGVLLGQVTGTTVQNLGVAIKRLTATVTPGTGGSAATPQPAEDNNPAATATARTNDTTVATTSGSTEVLYSDVFNTVNGYQFYPPEEDRPSFRLNQACIISLINAPSSPMTMSGTLTFAERI